MTPFAYSRASSPKEAVAAVARDPHAAFLGGGTTLVDLMQLEVVNPGRLVDITPLALTRIETLPGGGIRVGALVRNSDLANDPSIRRRYPVLSEAILSGRVRPDPQHGDDRGNLLQRTRCQYFRDVFRRATSGSRAAAARRSADTTGSTRSSERATTASRRSRATCRWRSPRWTRSSGPAAPDGDGTADPDRRLLRVLRR